MKLVVKLDGELAHPYKTKGAIGSPILSTVNMIKDRLAKGDEIYISTTRLICLDWTSDAYRKAVESIENWCLEHVGHKLPIEEYRNAQSVK